jgi:hypothetical protein
VVELPMRALLLAGLLALVMAAGCLSGDDGDSDPDVDQPDYSMYPHVSAERLADPAEVDPDAAAEFPHVIISEHGTHDVDREAPYAGAPLLHTIRALHRDVRYGLNVVGYNDLTDKLPPGSVGTGWSASGLWQNYACVAAFAGTGSMAIVDIADPTNPVVVSQTADAMVNGDCQFTADGKYLFAGAYIGANACVPDGPCPLDGPEGNVLGEYRTNGVNVWNVEDKANPQHILWSDTGQYHTLQLHTDPDTNQTYLIQAYAGSIYRFDSDVPALVEVNVTTPMEHDMWVAQHPITGKWLLYTGEGDGFVIYDFDDPENPTDLAHWLPDENVTGSQGWHRQEQSTLLIDGKAIVVVAGETCGSGRTLPYAVVDVTDVTAPKTLSHWEIPGQPETTDPAHLCDFSPHEFSIYDGYVATGNYHAGVWVFDIGSAERLLDPVTIGYYLPDREPAVEGNPLLGAQDLTMVWNPFVWGAFFDQNGYILVGDFSSGLYMLELPGVSGVPAGSK